MAGSDVSVEIHMTYLLHFMDSKTLIEILSLLKEQLDIMRDESDIRIVMLYNFLKEHIICSY